jgi:O-antigen/teichoic acid export membrane protein
MISKLLKYFQLDSTNHRTATAKKNITISFFVKLINIFIGILIIPLTLKVLNRDEYGLWLTINSILSWVIYFDIGLGSGLRNKFAEAKTISDYKEMKTLVSTAYVLLTLIISFVIILFLIFSNFVHWDQILNTNLINELYLKHTIQTVFIIFGLQFILRLINSILEADQKSGQSDIIGMLSNITSYIFIYLIYKYSLGKLFIVGVVFTSTPLLITLIVTIYLFKNRYSNVRPSFSDFKLKYYKKILSLGGQFFIIQICGLITIGSTNIIITQMFGPLEVVNYNIIFKYFSFTLIGFSVITSSYFSAFTDAYYKNDFDWIEKSVSKINKIWFLLFLGIIFLALCSKYILKLWVGDSVIVSNYTVILMAIYFSITTWATVYATFISGVGKLRIAYYVSIINSVLHIPLTIFLAKFIGVQGVIVSQIILSVSGLYWLPKQYKLLISRNAIGIWNK